jgi:hypothetical protein
VGTRRKAGHGEFNCTHLFPPLAHGGGAEKSAESLGWRAIVAANSGNSRDLGEEEIRWRMTS